MWVTLARGVNNGLVGGAVDRQMDVEEWTGFVCSEMGLSGGPFRLIECKRWIDSVACQLLIFLIADLPQVGDIVF